MSNINCVNCKSDNIDNISSKSSVYINGFKYYCDNCKAIFKEEALLDKLVTIPVVLDKPNIKYNSNSPPKRDDDYSDRGFSGCKVYYN